MPNQRTLNAPLSLSQLWLLKLLKGKEWNTLYTLLGRRHVPYGEKRVQIVIKTSTAQSLIDRGLAVRMHAKKYLELDRVSVTNFAVCARCGLPLADTATNWRFMDGVAQHTPGAEACNPVPDVDFREAT